MKLVISPLTVLGVVIALNLSSAKPLAVADDPHADPCTLVSRADVEQIVGKLKENPKSSRVERASVCEYQLASGKDFLSIWLLPAEGLDRARRLIENLAPASDVGHDALTFQDHPSRDELGLIAKKGNATVQIILTKSASAADQVKAIARKALGRL